MLFANLYESIIFGSFLLSKDFLIFFFILNIFVFYLFPLGVVTDIFFKRSFVFLDSLIIYMFSKKAKDFSIQVRWCYIYHIYNIYILIIIIIDIYIGVFPYSPLQNIDINIPSEHSTQMKMIKINKMKKFLKFKIIKILFYISLPFFSFVACMVTPFFFCSYEVIHMRKRFLQ